ncbi:MAG: 21, gp21 [Marmoricola sp.]|nr:21, gp21 [Marmoricola sp.]
MTVAIFTQPAFTAQDAATYKSNIDDSLAVAGEIVKQFAPREMAVLGMGVTVEAGSLMDGTVIPATSLTGIGAPAANPRIDRVYFDMNTRLFVRLVGTEAAVPVPPAYPFGVYPIAQLRFEVGDTMLTNEFIVDDRPGVMIPACFLAGDAYTTIIDAAGLARVLIGKAGVDNRVIVRMQQNDGSSRFEIQQSDGTIHFAVHDSGILIPGVLAVADLPPPSGAWKNARAMVSDGSVVAAGNFGTIVAGGGANNVPVYCDSAQWRIG